MAMGKRNCKRQNELWVPSADIPSTPGHPFYQRLNAVLAQHGFDAFVEEQCRRYYSEVEEGRIVGHCAIGPGDDKEADRIWRELAEQEPWLDLRELVRRGLAGTPEEAPLAVCLRGLSFSASELGSRFTHALYELQELHGEQLEHAADRALVAALDLQHFVTLPLVRAERSLGFLLIDNRYSGVSLAPERIDVLQVLVRFATGILENLLLRESLERWMPPCGLPPGTVKAWSAWRATAHDRASAVRAWIA